MLSLSRNVKNGGAVPTSPGYFQEDVELLLRSCLADSPFPDTSREEQQSKERVDSLLRELNCERTEKLVAVATLSIWFNWNSPERTNRILSEELLTRVKSTLSEDQQERIRDIENAYRIWELNLSLVEEENVDAVKEFEYGKEGSSVTLRWQRPRIDVFITNHVILLDLCVDRLFPLWHPSVATVSML